MKIAIPTREGFVEDNLACCECYTIYTIDDNYNIVESESLYPGNGGCCLDSPAARLRRSGVSVVLAGNVETSIYTRMTGFGMEVHRNYHGEVDHVVKNFLGKLVGTSLN